MLKFLEQLPSYKHQTCPKNCASYALRYCDGSLFITTYYHQSDLLDILGSQSAVQLVLSYCLKRQALLTRGGTNLRCSEQNRA